MQRLPPTLEIIYFDAGGGHRSAAQALRQSIEASGIGWRVELIQLQDLFQSVDPIYKVTGLPSEEIYNAAIKRGWTYGSRPFLRTLQKGISLEAPALKRCLQRWWSDRAPSLVVSVIPNFNRIIFDALRRVHPAVPFVTVMTDLIDTPPHFWMENQDQYLICGTRKATIQAVLSGFYRPERVISVSGMIIRPSFYDKLQTSSPALLREELGLQPHSKVAIVSYGGNGSGESVEVVERLRLVGIECIVFCGRNEKLFKSLQGQGGIYAVPFTDRVPDYMRLADFFVGKPGPGSISEALLMGLPVIISSNARTMIQERYNITWVEEQGVGLGVSSLAQLEAAACFLLKDGVLEEYRQRAASLSNRAVFEIPKILASILEEEKQPV